MAAASQRCCVFVGNIPYDVSEEQIVQICEEVGPVVSFRLVTDKETGKPKGYGFCEYKDEETALSARRNLQGYEINGRQLRVDFAENDKGKGEGRGGGGQTVAPNVGPPKLGDALSQQQMGASAAATAAAVMARALGGPQVAIGSNPNGQSFMGNDPLTLHLAIMSENQLIEVLRQFKEMATHNNKLAQELLLSNPQLSKAFLQVLIMLRLVPPQVLQQPNIRQGPLSAALNDSHLHVPAQTQFGLPPLPQLKLDPSVLPKLQEGQSSTGVPIPLVPNQPYTSHFQQVNPTQQTVYPVQSLVTELPNLHSQQILSSTIRPQSRFATPLPATHQMQPHLVQNSRQTASSQFQNQAVSSNDNLQTTSSIRTAVGDPRYQVGLTSLGTSQIKGQKVGPPGIREATSLPLRHVKLEDDRGASLPASNRPLKQVKLEGGSGVPAQAVGLLPKQVKLEGTTFSAPATARSTSQSTKPGVQPIEKQSLQLPPGMDPSILEQVLKLTPEQLSLLPPAQQQEVIQLQKMLSNSV